MVTQLNIKKRRPINKKEAKRFNKLLSETHGLEFSLSAGKYETAISNDFDVIIQQGHIFGMVIGDMAHLSVRGLLSTTPEKGWVQVDKGAVPFVCNGANVMAAGINAVSPEIIKGQYIWIREENYQKPLGIGKALLNADEMLTSNQGKAVEALHYIGDKIWGYGVKD